MTSQDKGGVGVVTDKLVGRALWHAWDAGANEGSLNEFEMRAALAAVAPDIAAEVRRQCAEELRILSTKLHRDLTWYDIQAHQRALAERWSRPTG